MKARPGLPNLLVLYQKYRIFGLKIYAKKLVAQRLDNGVLLEIAVFAVPTIGINCMRPFKKVWFQKWMA